MSNSYETGVIYGWNGGECPVHHKSEVVVWFRNQAHQYHPTFAEYFSWKHSDTDGDIIAFQVTKPYVEPKVIWVNKTISGYVQAYISEEGAKNNAQPYHTHIAVKYVEAKE